METNNLPKTDRVIELLDDLGELEAQKAILLSGSYIPDYVASQAQDLTFQIAEIAGEIVQIVKDLEDEVNKAKKYAAMWQRVANY